MWLRYKLERYPNSTIIRNAPMTQLSARAVLFDMDGTLLDTLRDIAESANAVLERQGLPVHDLQAYRHFVGSGVTELIRRVLPLDTSGDEEFVAACVGELKEEYAARWDKETQPYAGIPELIAALRERGVRMAVCTNKPQRFADIYVARYFPEQPFGSVQGPRDATPTKPDPFLALEAARELGVSPEQCLLLGDTDIDMQTAANAGMLPVGALWGFRDREELERSGAAVCIRNPLELLQTVVLQG